MADKSISQLPAATSVAAADLTDVVDMSSTPTLKKIRADQKFYNSFVPMLNAATSFAELDGRDKTKMMDGAFCVIKNSNDIYQLRAGVWGKLDLTGISQFTAEAGADDTVSALYGAGNTAILVSANVTETANIVLTAGSQLLVQVGQGVTWDLSTFKIDGAAGGEINLTIILTDSSSAFKWSSSSSPFINFDVNSICVISANGGSLINASNAGVKNLKDAVNNTAIDINGRLSLIFPRLVLPNASNGGINIKAGDSVIYPAFIGGGSNCEYAWKATGGRLLGVTISGTFADNALINDDSSTGALVENVYCDLDQAYSLTTVNSIDGLDFNNTEDAVLSVIINSNGSLNNAPEGAIVILPSGASNITVNNSKLANVDFANDGTNTLVSFNSVTLSEKPAIYGQGLSFDKVYFAQGADIDIDAKGSISNSNSAVQFTNTVGFSLSNNNSLIGNGYVSEIPVYNEAQFAVALTYPKPVIRIAETFTITKSYQLLDDTVIISRDAAAQIGSQPVDVGGVPTSCRIDKNHKRLTLVGIDASTSIATCIMANDGENFIYDSLGDFPQYPYTQNFCRVVNLSEVPNTAIVANCPQVYNSASVKAANADSAGVYITQPNSLINGLTVLSANSPASTNIFKADESIGAIDKLSLYNLGAVFENEEGELVYNDPKTNELKMAGELAYKDPKTGKIKAGGTLAAISFFNPISQLFINGENPSKVVIGSSCSLLQSTDGSDIDLNVNGGNPHLNGLTVRDLDTTASTNCTIVGSYASGTYAPAADTVASGCSGSIINTPVPLYTVIAKTDESFTAVSGVLYLLTAAASDLTINLPPASDLAGKYLAFKRLDSESGLGVEIDATAGTINGGASFYNIVGQNTFVQFFSDGTNYWTN